MKMFETAVIGVIAPLGLAAVRSCVECRSASRSDAPCSGFGPGCLAPPRRQDAASESSSRRLDKA
jgi:hypothetical protein